MEKTYINAVPRFGYTNVVTVAEKDLKTIHISGQVSEGDDFATQAKGAFEGVRTQLAAAGATPADVIKLNTYIVDLTGDRVKEQAAAKARVFNGADLPASTMVGIKALFMPQYQIEVEAIAVTKESSMEIEHVNPDTMPAYKEMFSQAVAAKHGGAKTIYVSGQVGIGKDGKVAGDGELAAQADQAFKNVILALEGAGATAKDVTKLNVYIAGLDGEKSKIIGEAKAKYFDQENQPASTWIGVDRLISRRYQLEVEAVAQVDA